MWSIESICMRCAGKPESKIVLSRDVWIETKLACIKWRLWNYTDIFFMPNDKKLLKIEVGFFRQRAKVP